MGGTCSRYGVRRGVYRVLVGKRGKEVFVRARGRWKNNFKVDLQEFGSGCIDWIDLAQNMYS